jgi:hypothetical protein
MTPMGFYPELKRPMTVLAILATLGALVFAVRGLPSEPVPAEPTPPPAPVTETYEPKRMTLEGTLVCLPHAPGYPPTKECAIGLRTDDGTHYAFDTMLMSSIPEEHRVGDRITGNGVFTPIERLSTDHWRKYTIVGIFSVTDGFKVVK